MESVKQLKDTIASAIERRDAIKILLRAISDSKVFTHTEASMLDHELRNVEASISDMETRLRVLHEQVETQTSASSVALMERVNILDRLFSEPPCASTPELMNVFMEEDGRLRRLLN
tara:strand:- start:13 stop:363 length:351 start_codon:yes stop_codon:yes gene_type:complete